jgi:outer membrane lipoprotein-sorting protein
LDRATGDAVFDITFEAGLKDKTRHRVWIDPQKKYITKREWYHRKGNQQATFFYTDAQNVGGIWMPTKMQVKNVDGALAGEIYYTGLKVNQNLPDNLFDVS